MTEAARLSVMFAGTFLAISISFVFARNMRWI
jgi:hypothetical protein